MLAQIIGHIDAALGWLERTPWGQKVIAALLSGGVSLWAYATTTYPPAALAIVFVVLFWMGLDIEARLIPKWRDRLGLRVQLENDGIAIHEAGQLRCRVFIHNRSKRKVVLNFDAMTEYSEPSQAAIWDFEVGSPADLGPDGHATLDFDIDCARWVPHDPLVHRHRHWLRVRDRLSGRRKRLEVFPYVKVKQ